LSNYPGLNTGGVLSPDGSRVAATISKDGNPEIYLLEAGSGKIIKRLTNADGIDTSPTWSPDGSQIAFVSDRHGTPQIWVMGADGSGARRLTFQGDYNQTPDWSPRGDLIAFTARDERYKFDVFTVNVSTGEVQRVTQDQGNNEEPSFSPDGRYLIFSSTRSGESKLYLSTVDGRVQHPVSQGKGEYLTPAWQR
jgi:TolB protein